jgi:hypothetical protein
MGWNRTGQAPQQPQRNTAPNWQGQGNPRADALRRTARPQQGMRPQMQRPQRPMQNMRPQMQRPQRPQMGGPSYGQGRAAERRQGWGQGPQPTEQQRADWMLRTTNPSGYRAQKKIQELEASNNTPLGGMMRAGVYGPRGLGADLSSPWMSGQGMIAQDGTRISADDLKARGYVYSGGFADADQQYAAGWYKDDARIRNPEYQRWLSEREGDGMGWAGGGGKNPHSEYMTVSEYDKYWKQKNAESYGP